jgi:hypothetical protein
MVSVVDDVNAPTSLSNSARAPFSIDGDCFGSFLLGGTLSKETLTAWSEDPIVAFEGSRVSLFDLLQVESEESQPVLPQLPWPLIF